MTVQTITKKQNITLKDIAGELRDIKSQLAKILFLIPEESLEEYKNSSKIRSAYLKALKVFPPK